LADDPDRLFVGKPIQARPIARVERVWRWCRRNPLAASLRSAGSILLLAVVAGQIEYGRQRTAPGVADYQKSLEVRGSECSSTDLASQSPLDFLSQRRLESAVVRLALLRVSPQSHRGSVSFCREVRKRF
jgi:hypothetical protein